MIDIELIHEPVSEKEFITLPYNKYPILFLGFVIHNEYDNKRIELNPKYNPQSFFHITKAGPHLQVLPLKGVLLKPNASMVKVINAIVNQEKTGNIGLVTYENLISQYNLSCKNTYKHFQKGVYPIDFNNLKSICDDSFNEDKKIFQHLLNLKEDVFDFQKFASLKLFILSV